MDKVEKPKDNTSKKNNNTVGYTIAIITIGMAIGNMFVAGKLRRMKIPQVDKMRDAHNSANYKSSFHYKEWASRHGQDTNTARAGNASPSESKFPSHISKALHDLELPIKDTLNKDEIKAAYRAQAMRFHPDRLHESTEAGKRNASAEKFKRISESYQHLDAYFK